MTSDSDEVGRSRRRAPRGQDGATDLAPRRRHRCKFSPKVDLDEARGASRSEVWRIICAKGPRTLPQPG